MKSITSNADFKHFVDEIKIKIHSSHTFALKSVNKELIALYSDIGKIIVQRQERFSWGKSVVERLSKELQGEIGRLSGFSSRNLWNMRNFYLAYKDNPKLHTLSAEISWSHNVLIFQKCKDDLQKEFYIKSTLKHAWSCRVLDNHINNQTYEKSLLSQNNFESTLPQNLSTKATLILKYEYIFDFLSLNDEHSERELELALIKQVREFLAQMGSEYAFMGNQYKLEADGQEFFIDLLLYHRGLKSLIAIEPKIGAFKPEYAGKMNFYLSLLNDKVRLNDENPSIGVATYTLTNTLPKDLAKCLPTPKEIEKNCKDFFDE